MKGRSGIGKWGVLVLSLMLMCSGLKAGFAAQVPEQLALKLKSIVHEVKAYAKQHGDADTYRQVSPDGKFGVKQLGSHYAWILRNDGTMVAHGANSAFNGKNFFVLRDASGRFFVKEFVKKAKAGGGFVFYKWSNPITHKIQKKVAYCEVFNDNSVVCAGAYLK